MHCFLCCGEVVLCPGKYDFPDLFFLFYLTYQFLDLVVSDSKSGYFPAKISVREKEKKDRQGLAGGRRPGGIGCRVRPLPLALPLALTGF